MKVYCIGLYDNSTQKYAYFPTFTFTEDATNEKNVKISQDKESITLEYSGPENLLNTSQIDIVKKGIIPSVTGTSIPNTDLKTFADGIAKKQIPFAMFIEFYKNPNSPITGEYTTAQLMLMDGITKNPAKNQKGELICDIHNDVPLEKANVNNKTNLNAINATAIKENGPDQSIKSLKPTILVALKQGAASMFSNSPVQNSTTSQTTPICTFMKKVIENKKNPAPGPIVALSTNTSTGSGSAMGQSLKPNAISCDKTFAPLYKYIFNCNSIKIVNENASIFTIDFTKTVIINNNEPRKTFFGFSFFYPFDEIDYQTQQYINDEIKKFFASDKKIDFNEPFIILFENKNTYNQQTVKDFLNKFTFTYVNIKDHNNINNDDDELYTKDINQNFKNLIDIIQLINTNKINPIEILEVNEDVLKDYSAKTESSADLNIQQNIVISSAITPPPQIVAVSNAGLAVGGVNTNTSASTGTATATAVSKNAGNAVSNSNPQSNISAPINQNNAASTAAGAQPPQGEPLYDYIIDTNKFDTKDNTKKYDFTRSLIENTGQSFLGFYFPYSENDIKQALLKTDDLILELVQNFFIGTSVDFIKDNSFVILFEFKKEYDTKIKNILIKLRNDFVFTEYFGNDENNEKTTILECIDKMSKIIMQVNNKINDLTKIILPLDKTALNGYTVKQAEQKGGAPNENHSLSIYGGDPKQDATMCISNLTEKNRNITPEQATRVCNALNGIFTENPDRTENVPKIFEKILHLWFLDNSIMEEIFHAINSPDLCFLHKIIYSPDLNKFILLSHLGKHIYSLSNSEISEYYNIDLNFDKYIQTQINGCKSKLLAIPLSYPGHSTMLIIEKMDNDVWGCFDQCGWFNKPRQIIVDHFDPSYASKEYNKENPVEQLIQNLFKQYAYQINYFDEVCPDIQNVLFKSANDYAGSCTQFSMLYAFKRLLEPKKSREQINKEMEEIFGKDPEKRDEAMANLVRTFQSLININFTKNAEGNYVYKVGSRELFNTSKQLNAVSIHTSDDLFNEINKQESLYISNNRQGLKYKFNNKIIVHNGIDYLCYYFENTDDFETFAQKIDEIHKDVFLNMTYPNFDLLKNSLAKKEPFIMLLENENLKKNVSDYQFYKNMNLTDADNKYYESFVEILFIYFISNGGEIVSKTDIENNKNDYIVESATTKGGALKRFAQQTSIPRIYRPVSQRKTDYYNYT